MLPSSWWWWDICLNGSVFADTPLTPNIRIMHSFCYICGEGCQSPTGHFLLVHRPLGSRGGVRHLCGQACADLQQHLFMSLGVQVCMSFLYYMHLLRHREQRGAPRPCLPSGCSPDTSTASGQVPRLLLENLGLPVQSLLFPRRHSVVSGAGGRWKTAQDLSSRWPFLNGGRSGSLDSSLGS